MAAYAREYGTAPPQAPLGYAAMTLLLDAIRRGTDNGRKPARRSKIVAALLAHGSHQSVLGPYAVDSSGDTSIRSYGIYRVAGGRLVFVRGATG